MPRRPTTYDPFNAIAEPRRRRLLEVLGEKELPVNEIVEQVGWSQSTVSKHLGVLKQVGLVKERRDGRHRLYRVTPERLKLIYDWVAPFQAYWSEKFDRLDQVLQSMQEKEK